MIIQYALFILNYALSKVNYDNLNKKDKRLFIEAFKKQITIKHNAFNQRRSTKPYF